MRPHRFWAIVFWLPALQLAPSSAVAGPIGGNFEISGSNCRFPDAAHGLVDGRYLVVWADYGETRVHGRFVNGDGGVSGAPFRITEAPFGGLFPAVAYGATADEFLVTWDDFGQRGERIHGQRIRASDGALLGGNFAIGSHDGGIRSAVAWSNESNVFLVAYFVPGAGADVFAQRVSGAGALVGANLNLSADGIFSGYAAIAWGESGNQFLVTWDNEDGNIRGRRVSAATGAALGPSFAVTAGGAKDRSCVAYDPHEARWLVQFNDAGNPGFSYDQYGRFVSSDGTPLGGLVPLAHSTGFEGDTQFGGDIAFAPEARRFFSSFGTDTGMGGQESFSSGAPAGPPLTVGTGYYTSLSNACDTGRNRFLTVWEGLEGVYRIYGQLHGATLGAPLDFEALSADSRIDLSWKNPDDPHFTGTVIRFKEGGYPEGPEDGELLVDAAGAPGSTGATVHTGLANGTTYYYAAFAHDAGPNYSPAAGAASTPRPPALVVHESDFATDDHGWSLVPWRSGALSPGTVARDPLEGAIVTSGSGVTNNQDTCTREGGLLTRAISTAGRTSIQIEYDVEASLHAPPAPSGAGACAVLEGGAEDKLVVQYSTTGTSGPWTTAEVIAEGRELPTPWRRRLINLAGIPAVNDNASFALRFHWQLNHERDSGRLDNIRVLSGATTGPEPAISLSSLLLERTVEAGENLPADAFHVSNSGEGVLSFDVAAAPSWLTPSPATASSAGPPRRVDIAYSTTSLGVGDHDAAIEVSSPGAANSPQTVTVLVHVIPPNCFREPFRYYDGALTTMGSASWSGSAASEISVEDEVIEVVGGAGAVSAARAVSCPSGTIIDVGLRIRKGTGTGDFFWNIAIDDDSGAGNLARFYGGSTIARGRVGDSITGDLVLSGSGAWDELSVRLNTAANTSEFFFNGVSVGTIPHGGNLSDRIGSIRIERLDRAGTGGNAIRFDDLIVESASAHPFHRGDPDSSGATAIADAVHILAFLFRRGPAPACAESADLQNDGQIDISDPIFLLLHLFAGGPPPPQPGPAGSPCGSDSHAPGSAGDLGCERYDPCG